MKLRVCIPKTADWSINHHRANQFQYSLMVTYQNACTFAIEYQVVPTREFWYFPRVFTNYRPQESVCSLLSAMFTSIALLSVGLLCGNEPGWSGSEVTDLCYKYFGNLMNFGDAQTTCTTNGGILADPRNHINQVSVVVIFSSRLALRCDDSR